MRGPGALTGLMALMGLRGLSRLAGLGAIVLLLAGCSKSGSSAPGPAGTQTYSGLSRDHVDTPVDYEQDPPVGGEHARTWQNCGFYDSRIEPEYAVHSLEHGAVWITFRPDLADEDKARIRELASQSYVLASPYDGLREPVVVSAWGKQLRLPSVDDPRLEEFLDAFRSGPQTPEPGAPCDGGVGRPA
jgi:hypothetical protein